MRLALVSASWWMFITCGGILTWPGRSRGRSYAPRGQTPVVRPSHKRASVGVISAVTNEGDLRWMVLNGALTAVVLIMFLQRLIRDAGCKVFLIMDRLPVHRAAAVKAWLAQHRAQIKVYYLPAYSPELNPDEGINGDIKRSVTTKPPARSRAELKRNLICHMRKLSRLPERVRSLFQHPTFRYAAEPRTPWPDQYYKSAALFITNRSRISRVRRVDGTPY